MGCERLHEVMFFFEIPHFSNIGNCLSKQFKLAKTFCLPTQPPEVNMHKAPSLNLILKECLVLMLADAVNCVNTTIALQINKII